MVMLTLDRCLVFYFTIKYPTCCISEKLLKTLYIVVALTLIIVLILLVLFQYTVIHFWMLGFTALFAMTVLDTLYFIEEVSTYIYIFMVYKRQTKLRKISYNGRINHDQFKFTIPTLIITTYVLLTTVFQNFWSFFMMRVSLENYLNINKICRIMCF